MAENALVYPGNCRSCGAMKVRYGYGDFLKCEGCGFLMRLGSDGTAQRLDSPGPGAKARQRVRKKKF